MLANLQKMQLLCNMKVSNLPPFPCVMGIVNVTPDSFYEGSRVQGSDALRQRVRQILDEGGRMIDVGAYSTRPGAAEVTAEQELERLRNALPVVRKSADAWCQEHGIETRIMVSVDTYRARVAEVCVTELGADVINDVSGGTLDPDMLSVVARTGVPYILMHMRGTPQTMQLLTEYPEGVTHEVIAFCRGQIAQLQQLCAELGKPMGEVILDPGYGFAKTLEQNYELMQGLDAIRAALPGMRVLVGISRKSMIYRLLGTDADHALNGTTVLNTYALLHGADILRVHDVREAVEAVHMVALLK